jgi:hypothetical protein
LWRSHGRNTAAAVELLDSDKGGRRWRGTVLHISNAFLFYIIYALAVFLLYFFLEGILLKLHTCMNITGVLVSCDSVGTRDGAEVQPVPKIYSYIFIHEFQILPKVGVGNNAKLYCIPKLPACRECNQADASTSFDLAAANATQKHRVFCKHRAHTLRATRRTTHGVENRAVSLGLGDRRRVVGEHVLRASSSVQREAETPPTFPVWKKSVSNEKEVFYTQYDLYDWLKKNSYLIEKDLYVRIWRLRSILYNWFFSCRTVVFKGRTGNIGVLLKMQNGIVVI